MRMRIVLVVGLATGVLVSGFLTNAPTAVAKPWSAAGQMFPFVDVATPAQKPVKPASSGRAKLTQAGWPQAAEGSVGGLSVGGTAQRAGDTPVSVSVPAKAKHPATGIGVEVRSAADSQKLVGPGVVIRVSGEPGSSANISLDYSGFADAAGGGYGSRLHLVRLPDCAADQPDSAKCRTQTSLTSTNSVQAETVSASVTLPEAQAATTSSVMLAAVAGTSSDQGSWARTSLNPASLWQAGGSSGAFTWTYPFKTPPVAGSLTPSLALSYNSGTTDGAVSRVNTQSSWVGEGFDLSVGFIERTYNTCAADQTGASNGSNTQDLCWFTDAKLTNDAKWDNATLSLAGHAGPLVRVGNTTAWRLKDDDGTRVEKVGSVGTSSAASSEYWKVTTPDGTQYYFGKGKADGSSAAATNSRWMVPVAANQTGEPGYSATFTSTFVSQPWRWNLDYVVDPSGDTMTVYYDKETNRYLQNGTTQTDYDRGGTISSIFYGERQGSESGSPAAKVTFVTKERCDTTVSLTCETTDPTAATVAAWPDVPTDAICVSGGYCPDVKAAPTFFTRKRLAQVNTWARNSTNNDYDPVDTWDLTGIFPPTNDTTSTPTMWLNTITRTGKAGTAITLPTTTLQPAMMHSRITSTTGATYGLNRPRMSTIWSESGARTDITYSNEDCTPTSLPTDPATNTSRCFPSYYSADGVSQPAITWFAKYVVTKVQVYDPTVQTVGLPTGLTGTELSSTETTSYTYSGGGAWRWDDSALTPDNYRTWNQWRGYGKVTTVEGTGSTESVTEDTWFRGMNGDRANTGGTSTKTVNVTDSTGTSLPDDDPLSGQLRESRTLTSVGGSADTRTITDPWSQATSGVNDGRNQATMVDTAKTTATQYLSSGSRTTVTTVKTRDSWGQPTATESEGDTAVTGDERCTRTSYATPTGSATAIDLVAEQTVMPNLCSTPASEASMISGGRRYYDGSTTLGQLTGPGFVTRVDQLVGSTSHTWRAQYTAGYDQHGRALSVADALGHSSSVAYSPATNRAPTTVTATSIDPDGAGPSPAQVTTTTLDPRFGIAVKTVAPAGQTTEQTLDALGRTTAVWLPGTPSSGPASAKYTYVVNQNSTGVNATKTETLAANGTYYRSSWQILDGLLRVRQTQTESAATGSQVTDIRYDSRGNATLADSYLISALPTSSLVVPTSRSNIPSSTRTTYDYANRTLTAGLYSAEVKKWQTTNAYSGDRVDTTPPSGGTPTTTVWDVHGRTTQLTQHLGTTIAATPSTTSYSYTPAGQLASMTDPKGNTWTYTWDLQGNRLTSSDPDSGTTTTTYNELNQPVTVTDARGKGVKYTYDNLGRVTKTTSLDDATTFTTASYDTIGSTNVPGLPVSSSRWVNGAEIKTSVNSYDNAGRPTSTSVTVPAITSLIPSGLAGTYTTTTSYNLNGTTATVGLPATGPVNAETLTYGYNTKGAATTLTGMVPVVKSTAYTQWDTVSTISMGAVSGNAISMLINRDQATLRLSEIRTSRQISGTDEDTTYSWDDSGNLIGAKDTLKTGTVDNQCFQYDYQGQLTQAFTAAPTTTCNSSTTPKMDTSGPSPYWTTWTTDTIGKTSQRVDRNPASTSTTAYTYPANGSAQPHTITSAVTTGTGATTRSYGYDSAGNTTSRPSPTGVTQTLIYNDEGQLSHIDAGGTGVFDAIYDASGARIVKREAGKTTLTVAGTDLTVDNTSGALTASRYYTWQGLTVGVRTGNTNDLLWSIVTDHQGTAHNQVRNSDSQLQTSWQDPYGNQRGAAPTSWAGLKGFVDGTKDATGLVRVGARDYDPLLNRFTTVDPLLDLADPLQANPYGYADNSPVTGADPSGLMRDGGPRTCPVLSTLSYHPGSTCGGGGSSGGGSGKGGAKKRHYPGLVREREPGRRSERHHPTQPHPKAPAPPPTPVPVPVTPTPLPTKAPNGMPMGAWLMFLPQGNTLDPGGGGGLGPGEAAEPAAEAAGEGEAPGGGEAPGEGLPGAYIPLEIPEPIEEEVALAGGEDPAITGIVGDAANGSGMFGLGSGTAAQAEQAGQKWVGPGARLSSDGKAWVSQDGLRQWRPPAYKGKWGVWQSNFESRSAPSGPWTNNGHLHVVDLP